MTLPFDMTPGATAFMAFALLAASYVRGYSGFGFSALVVSSASLVTNPLLFVPVVLLCEMLMTVQQARGIRAHVDWRRVGGLCAGALIGAPLGIWGLTSVGVDAARAAISVFVLAMCGLLLAGWQVRGVAVTGRVAHAGVGLASGIANGAGVGGLPVAVYFAAQPIEAAVFRASLIAYFTLLDLGSLPLLAGVGLISRDTLVVTVLALPILALGIWLGGRRFAGTAPTDFRRFAIMLLAVIAVLGLVKAAV